MTLPALLFGMVLSTLYGAGFHVWRGGGIGRLLLYIILSWIGFWIGQFIAMKMNWTILHVGPLNLGVATLFSIFFLLLGHWLSQEDRARK